MRLHPGEPEAGPWRVAPLAELVRRLLTAAGPPPDRPAVLGIGGRGSSGKTTLTARLAAAIPGSAVVHTDDVAWHHAVLAWDGLLATGVLAPVRRGEPVAYRPPAWDERGRPGAIEVPAGTRVLLVEGVGVTREALAPLLDATVWVQSDLAERERRDAVRVAAGEISPAGYAAWMAEEDPFVLADRAWERATVVVCGTPGLPHDPRTEVVLAVSGRSR